MLFTGGCVSEEIVNPNAEQTRLIVTRAGDETHISWQSQKDQVYTLMSADGRTAQARWTPVEGAVNLPGTGNTIERTDHVPEGMNRYYRLQLGVLKPQ